MIELKDYLLKKKNLYPKYRTTWGCANIHKSACHVTVNAYMCTQYLYTMKRSYFSKDKSIDENMSWKTPFFKNVVS